MPVLIYLLILALLTAAYLLAIRGRRNHPGVDALKGWSYAHRGLHAKGRPENSMAAFLAAFDGGYGIELDVHLLADGNLAIIHDSLLMRTTGKAGRIEDLTTQQLKEHFLEGTTETIPEFRQVLELYNGKYPLIVELKPYGNNHAALTEAACKMLDSYPGVYCLESFDPRCLLWLKKHRPELIRGQLSEDYYVSKTAKIPFILKWLLRENLGNFVTKPDFIAYKVEDRHCTLSNFFALQSTACVSWTVKSQDVFDEVVKEGWIPIFEGFTPDPTRRPNN